MLRDCSASAHTTHHIPARRHESRLVSMPRDIPYSVRVGAKEVCAGGLRGAGGCGRIGVDTLA